MYQSEKCFPGRPAAGAAGGKCPPQARNFLGFLGSKHYFDVFLNLLLFSNHKWNCKFYPVLRPHMHDACSTCMCASASACVHEHVQVFMCLHMHMLKRTLTSAHTNRYQSLQLLRPVLGRIRI